MMVDDCRLDGNCIIYVDGVGGVDDDDTDRDDIGDNGHDSGNSNDDDSSNVGGDNSDNIGVGVDNQW